LKAATEQVAVDVALADCVKRDSNCQVIAIFGRTEPDHDLLAPEFDPSVPGELAELRMTVGLRLLANSINKLRYP